jgi:hypothetical protein
MPLKAAEVTPSMLVGVAGAWRAYYSDGRSHLMIEAFRRVESIQASGEERKSGLIARSPFRSEMKAHERASLIKAPTV